MDTATGFAASRVEPISAASVSHAAAADRLVTVTATYVQTATEAQWALIQELQAALPGATVTLRAHRLAWKRDAEAPAITVFGARVKYKLGPFTLCREYAAPGG